MPLFDADNPVHWEAHYHWAKADGRNPDPNMHAAHWAKVKASAPWIADPGVAGDRFLVGGAGRGDLVQIIRSDGFPNCWGIDSSSLLGSGRYTVSGGIVYVDRPMQGGGGTLAKLRQITGDDEFEWVISEDLVSCYDPTDPDLTSILDAAETVLRPGEPLSRIVHLVSVGWDPAFASAPGFDQPIEDWALLRPAHTWIGI